jgi:hypothetical protein
MWGFAPSGLGRLALAWNLLGGHQIYCFRPQPFDATAFDATTFSSGHNSGRADKRLRDIAFASRSSDQSTKVEGSIVLADII